MANNDKQKYLDDIRKEIDNYSVQPFKDWVAEIVDALPKSKDMKPYFKKYPDRAAQTLTIATKNAGYKQDAPIVQNNWINILSLSDSDLHARLLELDKERQALMARTIDGESEEMAAIPSQTIENSDDNA